MSIQVQKASSYTIVSTYAKDKLSYNVHKVGVNNRRNNTYDIYGERVETIPEPHTYVP